ASDHAGQEAAGQVDRRLHVDADLLELALDRQAVEAPDSPESGVVDQPVDLEVPALELRDQRRSSVGTGKVARDRGRPDAMRGRQLSRQALQQVEAASREHEVATVARDTACQRLADGAATPRA